MAQRPIFLVETDGPALVGLRSIEFLWYAGLAKSRRQMSMRSLHQATKRFYPEANILEVSRMSDEILGRQLSAFNLTIYSPKLRREISVENAFQASKVFERGGPYLDLLEASPFDAKRDPRLQDSGRLIGFCFDKEEWPNQPLTAFYDWLYLSALTRKTELAKAVLRYEIFTDIAFNPKKSINCQAGAAALFVSISRRGELENALTSQKAFMSVEGMEINRHQDSSSQGSLF